jgi:hypothetical protein
LKHYGEIVEKKVRELDLNISALASKLDISRQTLYEYFKIPNLGLGFIYRLGKVINYDFIEDIPEIKDYLSTKGLGGLEETDYWRGKYINLQDEYITVLKQKNDDLMKVIESMAALVNKISITVKK